jgi:hypothetical protein
MEHMQMVLKPYQTKDYYRRCTCGNSVIQIANYLLSFSFFINSIMCHSYENITLSNTEYILWTLYQISSFRQLTSSSPHA